jgi:hypothetical protein
MEFTGRSGHGLVLANSRSRVRISFATSSILSIFTANSYSLTVQKTIDNAGCTRTRDLQGWERVPSHYSTQGCMPMVLRAAYLILFWIFNSNTSEFFWTVAEFIGGHRELRFSPIFRKFRTRKKSLLTSTEESTIELKHVCSRYPRRGSDHAQMWQVLFFGSFVLKLQRLNKTRNIGYIYGVVSMFQSSY